MGKRTEPRLHITFKVCFAGQRYPIVSGPVGGSSVGVVPGRVGGSRTGGESGVAGTTGPLSGGSSTGRCPSLVGGSWAGRGFDPGCVRIMLSVPLALDASRGRLSRNERS